MRRLPLPNHDVGTIENISGAAMLASSTHRRAAQAFLRFLVGPTAQEVLARGDDFEYPVRPGIAPKPCPAAAARHLAGDPSG